MEKKIGKVSKVIKIGKDSDLKEIKKIEIGDWIKVSEKGTWFKVIKIDYFITGSGVPFFTGQEKPGYRSFVIDPSSVQFYKKGDIEFKFFFGSAWNCPFCGRINYTNYDELLEFICWKCENEFPSEMFSEIEGD